MNGWSHWTPVAWSWNKTGNIQKWTFPTVSTLSPLSHWSRKLDCMGQSDIIKLRWTQLVCMFFLAFLEFPQLFLCWVDTTFSLYSTTAMGNEVSCCDLCFCFVLLWFSLLRLLRNTSPQWNSLSLVIFFIQYLRFSCRFYSCCYAQYIG